MPRTTDTTVVTHSKTTIVTTTTPPNRSNLDWKVRKTAIIIVCYTIVLFVGFFWAFTKVDSSSRMIAVTWNNPDSITVEAGPSWFLYDSKADSIKSSRIINDLDKVNLLGLVKEGADSSRTFKNAISQLAFESNRQLKTSYLFIIILAAICGSIGVQLRTINNFIGITCFKNDFNYDVWWPWYIVRPLIGLFVGPVVFIIFDGKLIPMSGQFNYSTALVIAITILAGFAAEDVLNTLRTVSKRVFGYKEE